MSKGLRKAGLWGIIIWAVCMGSSASGASFTYEPITDPIESASFSVDFAAFTAHRTMADYELNYIKLVDLTGDLGTLDLSDDFFGTSAWPDEPQINMGELETGIVSAEIGEWFFPALAGGHIGLNFLFTDTGDSMFAMDFISLTLETAVETVTSYYGWPVGNENNGFGIGLADGADLPAPLSESIPAGTTGTGFDEAISSDTKIPEPTTLILLGLGGAYLLRKRGKKRFFCLTAAVFFTVISQTAFGITITDVNIYQMDFYGTSAPRIYDTNWGDFEFTILPDDDANDYFLNLSIRQDADNPEYWVIDNLMFPCGSEIDEPFTLHCYFSLEDLVESGTPLGSLEYNINISTWPTSTAPSGGVFVPAIVLDGLDDTGNGGGEEFAIAQAGPGAPPRVNPPLNAKKPEIIKSKPRRIPTVGEEPNECVLGATARSLLWLHNQKAINLGDKADPNKLMDTLKNAMEWKNGVREPNFLKGKLKISKDLKLDLVNKFVSLFRNKDYNSPDGTAKFMGKEPTFDFIKSQIDANEDLEIQVVWLAKGKDINDANFNTHDPNFWAGAHCLTIVQYIKDTANGKTQIIVQDDNPQQGRKNPHNQKRTTGYSKTKNVWTLNNKARNFVFDIISESPKPKTDNTHVYPPGGKYSPKVAVGAPASIKAAVQNNFVGVPGADVEFIKRAGSFTFTSGIILPDGSETFHITNDNGFSEITIKGDEAGAALIEAAVTGVENSSAYLLFDVIPCPISQNRDEDCDVDFIDYAIFADTWPGDLSELGLLCEQWLEGK